VASCERILCFARSMCKRSRHSSAEVACCIKRLRWATSLGASPTVGPDSLIDASVSLVVWVVVGLDAVASVECLICPLTCPLGLPLTSG
jgi:hypothetical protein